MDRRYRQDTKDWHEKIAAACDEEISTDYEYIALDVDGINNFSNFVEILTREAKTLAGIELTPYNVDIIKLFILRSELPRQVLKMENITLASRVMFRLQTLFCRDGDLHLTFSLDEEFVKSLAAQVVPRLDHCTSRSITIGRVRSRGPPDLTRLSSHLTRARPLTLSLEVRLLCHIKIDEEGFCYCYEPIRNLASYVGFITPAVATAFHSYTQANQSGFDTFNRSLILAAESEVEENLEVAAYNANQVANHGFVPIDAESAVSDIRRQHKSALADSLIRENARHPQAQNLSLGNSSSASVENQWITQRMSDGSMRQIPVDGQTLQLDTPITPARDLPPPPGVSVCTTAPAPVTQQQRPRTPVATSGNQPLPQRPRRTDREEIPENNSTAFQSALTSPPAEETASGPTQDSRSLSLYPPLPETPKSSANAQGLTKVSRRIFDTKLSNAEIVERINRGEKTEDFMSVVSQDNCYAALPDLPVSKVAPPSALTGARNKASSPLPESLAGPEITMNMSHQLSHIQQPQMTSEMLQNMNTMINMFSHMAMLASPHLKVNQASGNEAASSMYPQTGSETNTTNVLSPPVSSSIVQFGDANGVFKDISQVPNLVPRKSPLPDTQEIIPTTSSATNSNSPPPVVTVTSSGSSPVRNTASPPTSGDRSKNALLAKVQEIREKNSPNKSRLSPASSEKK